MKRLIVFKVVPLQGQVLFEQGQPITAWEFSSKALLPCGESGRSVISWRQSVRHKPFSELSSLDGQPARRHIIAGL